MVFSLLHLAGAPPAQPYANYRRFRYPHDLAHTDPMRYGEVTLPERSHLNYNFIVRIWPNGTAGKGHGGRVSHFEFAESN